jgi:GNAT superfamily N-acetyltransferase
MFVLRERTDADLDACVRLVAEVRGVDGYPPYLPDNDFMRLLTEPPPLVAFVATAGDTVVGHAALLRSTSAEAMALASEALGVEPARLGVVARLFAAVDQRRAGVGRLLLGASTAAARVRGLVPILDVWVELRAAVALYESAGWIRLGTVRNELPIGPHDVDVFVAPS